MTADPAPAAPVAPPLAARLRTAGRQTLSRGLHLLPDAAFAPLRRAYPATEPGSWEHRVLDRVLNTARHRGIPDRLEVFHPVDRPDLSFVRADSFVAERLYWFGERYGYENGGVRWWRHFCASAERILELGANIGYYTVQGGRAAPAAAYTAVEPHPGCAATCRRNLQVNGIANVTVVEAAAVPHATGGRVTLRLPGGRDHYTEAPCTGFVGREDVERTDTADPTYTELSVTAVELASLIEGVDLFKLDVEGQEYALLSTVVDELVSARPTIFLELWDSSTMLRSLIADLCAAAPYRCYVPTPDRLVPLSPDAVCSSDVKSRFDTLDIVLTCRDVPDGPPS